MFYILRDIIEAMKEHARKEYPRECCGMLAGTENRITTIYKTSNTAAGTAAYEMDPIEQLHVFEELDRLSLKLLGVYHSHPRHPCYPSALDISRAFYPDSAYVIISLLDAQQPQIKAFTMREGTVAEEEIVVC